MKEPLKNTERSIKAFFQGKEPGLKNLPENYSSMDEAEKLEFLRLLTHLGPKKERLSKLMGKFVKGNEKEREEALEHIRKELDSPRKRLFKALLREKGGLKTLLDIRSDAMRLGREMGVDLSPVEHDLVDLFESWFQEGFLYLSQITLDTSYRILSFVKEHDMVHPITSMDEMAERLGKDRLCFGLFHVLMPSEPVVFIEVALTKGIPGNIKEIVERRANGKKPDTAAFYSINNTQKGLAGLGIGRILIAKVVEEIKKSLPDIKNFCTLSPIPTLMRRYLRPLLKEKERRFSMKPEGVESIFSDEEKKAIFEKVEGQTDFCHALYSILENPKWVEDGSLVKALKRPMTEIVYFYLKNEKDKRGRPLDPVANFHLSNGAKLRKRYIRFLGNTYPYGLRDSASFMVNYIYESSWLEDLKNVAHRLPIRLSGEHLP